MDSCCKGNKCHIYSIEELDELIYKLKFKIVLSSDDYYREIKWDFKTCFNSVDYKIAKVYLGSLLRYRDAIIEDYKPNLNDYDIQILIEKVKDFISICCDLVIDEGNKENFNSWALQNPTCVGFEKWNRAFSSMEIGFEEEITEVQNQLVYELVQKNISCDLLYDIQEFINKCNFIEDSSVIEEKNDISLSEDMKENDCNTTFIEELNQDDCNVIIIDNLEEDNCEINSNDSISIEQCLIDYNILKDTTSCDLSFDEYRSLINCDLSYDLILKMYTCNIQVVPSLTDNKCPDIVLDGVIYSLCSLTTFLIEKINRLL